MRAPCCLNKRATPNGATPLIAPHYALRSLLSVASIPHAARISYHWTACAVNWLNFRRTGGSTCSGQVAQATPDRRLRRTGVFRKEVIDLEHDAQDHCSSYQFCLPTCWSCVSKRCYSAYNSSATCHFKRVVGNYSKRNSKDPIVAFSAIRFSLFCWRSMYFPWTYQQSYSRRVGIRLLDSDCKFSCMDRRNCFSLQLLCHSRDCFVCDFVRFRNCGIIPYVEK